MTASVLPRGVRAVVRPAPPACAAPLLAAADRDAAFARLAARAQACRACPAMEGRRRVLGPGNGPADARVVFIAEAPGRRGGEVTGVPLSRDASGLRFGRLLALAGLERGEVFVTNAVLCNPRAANGTNRPPTRAELANCAGWLRAQLDLIDPPVVVTLGAVALAALGRIEPHGATLRADVGRAVPWRGRLLVPLYHPSPRAGLSRPYAAQDEDFRRLGTLIRSLAGGACRGDGRLAPPPDPLTAPQPTGYTAR